MQTARRQRPSAAAWLMCGGVKGMGVGEAMGAAMEEPWDHRVGNHAAGEAEHATFVVSSAADRGVAQRTRVCMAWLACASVESRGDAWRRWLDE